MSDANITPADCLAQIESFSRAVTSGDISALSANHPVNRFITNDPACHRLKTQTILLSSRPETVLITGRSGTGKEIIASSLKGYNTFLPFIAVNCAALPDTLASSILQGHVKGTFTGATDDRPGVFEAADRGIVFLDEIGDMPLPQQAILLRILQEREVLPIGAVKTRPIECRIIAATNQSLTTLIKRQEFRADLYARLMTFELRIPSFSERPDDARYIARHFNLPDDIPLDDLQLEEYGVRYIQAQVARHSAGMFNL